MKIFKFYIIIEKSEAMIVDPDQKINTRTAMSPPEGAHDEMADSSSGTPKVQINQQTKDKAASVKAYIENKYAKAKYEERERKEAWDKLN